MTRKRNILVTGNLGYVGSVLVPWISRHLPEIEITGLDAGWFVSALTTSDRAPETHLVRQIFGDIRDVSTETLRGFDAIIHLAAVSNDPIGKEFEIATRSINLDATVRLARLAASAGVGSFVLASSCSVYGASGDDEVDERAELAPLSAYAASKIESERELAALASKDFRVTALRFGTACGSSPRLRLDLVVNDLVYSALANNKITLLSDGKSWRPLVHVEDMCRALAWASQRDGSAFEVLNVGSTQQTMTVRALAEQVSQVVAGASLEFHPTANPDARSYRVSFDRFRRMAPTAQPRWEMMATIQDLVRTIGDYGRLTADFRKGPLIRLQVLRKLIEQGELSSDLRWRSGVVQ